MNRISSRGHRSRSKITQKAVRTGLFFVVVFFLSQGIFPVGAEMEVRFQGQTRELESLSGEDYWNGLPVEKKKELAPYLIDLYFSSKDSGGLKELSVRFSRESDPLLEAYGVLARIYTRLDDRVGRIKELEGEAARIRGGVQKELFLYQAAIEKNARAGRPVDSRANLACRIEGQADSCQLIRKVVAIYKKTRDPSLSSGDYRDIIEEIRPLITGGPRLAPFPYLVGWPLPDLLVELGLPLESAVVARRITSHSKSAPALELRSRIPFYLGAAGDFPGAIEYSRKYHIEDDPILLNIRMDWMIMGEKYKDAVDMLSSVGAEKLGGHRMAGMKDYWTNQAYNPSIVGIKLGMLFHLGGDTASAGKTLDHLTKVADKTSEGEPIAQYARLRMAQVFMEENPDLAHKIAEDVSYIAQEKGWIELEYQATVLDGWARYYQKEYYRSVVNFVKATGITRYLKGKPISPFSRELGLLAARRKMRPRSTYKSLVDSIHKTLEQEPYSRSVYVIRHFAPVSADEDFFVKQIVDGKNAQKKYWSGFNDLIEYYKKKNLLVHGPGKNPGGEEGLVSSSFWLKSMKRLPYINSDQTGIRLPDLSRGAIARIHAMEKEALGKPVTRATFRDTEFYFFAFPSGEDRLVYLIYPRKKRRGGLYSVLTYTRWSKEDLDSLRESCPSNGGSRICSSTAPRIQRFRRILAGRKHAYLNVLYTPGLGIDVPALLRQKESQKVYTVHFLNPGHVPDPEKEKPPVARAPSFCQGQSGMRNVASDPGFYERFTGPLGARGIYYLGEISEPSQASANPYLSRIGCGGSSILLLDMVRFDGGKSPEALVYDTNTGRNPSDRELVRYFGGRGTIVVQKKSNTGRAAMRRFQRIVHENVDRGLTTAFIRATYQTRMKYGKKAPEVILPGFPG